MIISPLYFIIAGIQEIAPRLWYIRDAAAYHFGNKINMEEALKEVPADALAMGNLDPVSLFKMSSPEEMKKATLQLLEATAAYPNFVLSSGCDIPPYTPLANINAFYTALEEFNETRN